MIQYIVDLNAVSSPNPLLAVIGAYLWPNVLFIYCNGLSWIIKKFIIS